MSKLSYEKSLINDSRKGAFRLATSSVTDSLILRLRKSPDHQGDGLALAFSHLSESENQSLFHDQDIDNSSELQSLSPESLPDRQKVRANQDFLAVPYFAEQLKTELFTAAQSQKLENIIRRKGNQTMTRDSVQPETQLGQVHISKKHLRRLKYEQFFSRSYSTNTTSGRQNQLLTCLICRQFQTVRMSSMIQHIKPHLRSNFGQKQ